MARLAAGKDVLYFENRYLGKDGGIRWLAWAASADEGMIYAVATDVTARKQAERHSRKLSDLRDTLLRCHGVIVSETDETALFKNLSKILAETLGYTLVWFGIPELDTEKTIKAVAAAGQMARYVMEHPVHWSEDEFSQGPTGRAVKTGEAQVIRKTDLDREYREWAEAARAYSFTTAIAIPLVERGTVFAIMNAFSADEDSFDDDEVALLDELGRNIGLAIQALRTESERIRIGEALGNAALGAINAISATVEKRDPYTAGHQSRVAALSVAIAGEMGWSDFRKEGLRLGALIHDIGKISVPAEILNRPGRLTDAEFGIIKSHPQVGFEIVEKTVFPWPIREMIVQHHERCDGTGYPNGLKGHQIVEEAKIIAVADVVEAMAAHRPYRAGLGIAAALEEVERGKGTAYDPEIADVCLKLFREDQFQWDDRPENGAAAAG